MSMPMQQFRWVMWFAVILSLVACVLLATGVLDQQHWDAFVRGLFTIAAGEART